MTTNIFVQNISCRDPGIEFGILKPGRNNVKTNVNGVKIGHYTLIKGDSIRTGVTAIIPHSGDLFQQKALYSTGYLQSV